MLGLFRLCVLLVMFALPVLCSSGKAEEQNKGKA
jgi:hypothetical protein